MKNNHIFLLLFFFFCFANTLHADTCNWQGNADTNWENPANWSCGNVPTTDDEVFIYFGDITISTDVEVGSIQFQQSANLLGTGSLTVVGDMNLLSFSTYTFEVAINVQGNADFGDITVNQNGQNMTLAGTSTWEDGTLWCNDGAQVIIPSDAEMTFEGGLNIFSFNPVPSLVVNGILNKQGAANLDFEAIYNFVDATINIQGGFITNYLQAGDNCLIQNSTVNMSGGGQLHIERNISIENTQFNNGIIRMEFGVASFKDGTDCSSTQLHLVDGMVNTGFPSNPSTVTFQYINQSGGELNGNGNGFVIADQFHFSGGVIAGNIEVLGFTQIGDLTPTSEIRSQAVLTVTGGGIMNSNDNFQNRIIIPEGSDFSISCDDNTTTSISDLQIFGTLIKTGDGLLDIYGFLYPEAEQRIVAKGPMTTPTFLIAGTLVPSPSSDVLELQNNLNFISDNPTFELLMFADGAGNAIFTPTEVDGDINLAGTLYVDIGGTLQEDMHTIMTCTGSVNNTFEIEDLPAGYEVIYLEDSVILSKSTSPDDLAVSATIANPISCFGANDACIDVIVTGGVPPYTIDLDGNPLPNNPICDLGAGEYVFTIMDAEGTVVTTDTTIIDEPLELVVTGHETLQNEELVVLFVEGGTMPYMYQYMDNEPQLGDTLDVLVVNDPLTQFFTVTDANGCLINYSFLAFSNTNEHHLNQYLSLSPNPSQGNIQLTIDFPTEREVHLSIFDNIGKKVYQTLLEKPNAQFSTSIDVQHLPAGAYTVLLNDGQHSGVKRLLIVK